MSDSEFVKAAKNAVQKIVDETPDESNLMIHARRELELLGEEPEIVEGYLKMIQIFADMGHSGSSASIFIPTLNRLLWFKNLTPLTDDPDEWVHHTEEVWGEPGGVWQNVRNGEAFSDDGGKTYTLLSEEAPTSESDKPKHTSAHRLPDGQLLITEDAYSTNDNVESSGETKEEAVLELCNALRLTVEYVGTRMLPPIAGWSWYDALRKYNPAMAKELKKSNYRGTGH